MGSSKCVTGMATILESLHIILKKCTADEVHKDVMPFLYCSLDHNTEQVQVRVDTSWIHKLAIGNKFTGCTFVAAWHSYLKSLKTICIYHNIKVLRIYAHIKNINKCKTIYYQDYRNTSHRHKRSCLSVTFRRLRLSPFKTFMSTLTTSPCTILFWGRSKFCSRRIRVM